MPGGLFSKAKQQAPMPSPTLGSGRGTKTIGANVTWSPENVQTVYRFNRYPDQYALGLVQMQNVNLASHVISGSTTLCLV